MKITYFIFLIALNSCVTAPKVDSARILPNQELEVITKVKEAKQLLATGRSDLAEKELLLALEIAPNQSTIYNDLGVVMLGQSRFSQAEQMFLRALELDSNNAVAQENYAKTLFRKREYFFSIKEFEKLRNLLFSKSEQEIKQASGRSYTEKDLVNIDRNISSAYFALGILDEALCYSNSALIKSPDVYQAGVHSRMLMLKEDLDQSYNLLNNTVTGLNYSVPAGMLLDHSVNSFLKNKLQEAEQSIELAAKNPSISADDKILTLLSSYLYFVLLKKDNKANALQKNIEENSKNVCKFEVKNSHMPVRFTKLLLAAQKKICRNDKKQLSSKNRIF